MTLLKRGIQKLSRRRDARQAGLIVLSQIAGQAVLLGTLPILSRLYSPAAFGEYTTFVGLATLIGSVASLGYLGSVYLTRGFRGTRAAYQLCSWLAFGICTVAGSCLAASVLTGLWTPFHGSNLFIIALLALSAGLLTHQNAVEAMLAREDRYRAVAWAKFNLTLFPALTQLALALTPLSAVALNLGRVIGQAAMTILSERALPARWRLSALRSPDWAGMRIVARAHADSLLHVPRTLLARGAPALLPLVVMSSFGAASTGLLFFADRVVSRPVQLLGEALSRIPQRNYAERSRNRQPVLRLVLGYSAAACVVALIPLPLLYFFGEALFAFVFGEALRGAGQLAAILAFPAAVKIATTPASALVPSLRLHSLATLLEMLFFPRIFLVTAAAALDYGFQTAMIWFALTSVAYDLLGAAWAVYGGWRHDRALARA